jgi:hypothetical protein
MSIASPTIEFQPFYRYRREVLGTDEAQARADMEQVWQPKGVWAAFVGR